MALKDKWAFPYPIEEIITATDKKIEHHKERYAHWSEKRQAAEKRLKEEGFEVREFDSGSTGYANTGSYGGRVLLDADLVKQFEEADTKRQEHGKILQVYRMWYRVLERRSVAQLELDAADVEFFGL